MFSDAPRRVKSPSRADVLGIAACLKILGYQCKVEWYGGRHCRIYRSVELQQKAEEKERQRCAELAQRRFPEA